jgi:predicted transcriptional regulator
VVSDALHEGLDRLARTRNCSKKVVIVQAIEDYLVRHEGKRLAAKPAANPC